MKILLIAFCCLLGNFTQPAHSADCNHEMKELKETLKQQEKKFLESLEDEKKDETVELNDTPEDRFSKNNPHLRSLYLQYIRKEKKYIYKKRQEGARD